MQLLTTREAAKKLGVSDRRVRRLIEEGRIKSFRVGGRNLVLEEDCWFERKKRRKKYQRKLAKPKTERRENVGY